MPIARVRLAHPPTAPERIPRPSDALGVDLWIERDDRAGMSSRGNETRKLEFLMAEARETGADLVMTQGATQSNRARKSAASAARMGMGCHVLVEDRTASRDPIYDGSGNVFLDFPHGATAGKHPGGTDMPGAMEARAEEARAEDRAVDVIPGGGPNATGALDYANCAMELLARADAMDLTVDRIVHATGSGGTRAGFVAGPRAIDAGIPLLGIGMRAPRAKREQMVYDLAVRTAERLGCPGMVAWGDVMANTDYVGESHGLPTGGTIAAIELFARHEGILPDPVHPGEGADGLIDLAREGRFAGETVVLPRAGGSVGLFGYAAGFGHGAPEIETAVAAE